MRNLFTAFFCVFYSGLCWGQTQLCEDADVFFSGDYTLTIESDSAIHVPGNTVYRFYVNMLDPTDQLSAVYGNDSENLIVNSPSGIFNTPYNTSWNASGINPVLLETYPEMAEDSYATVGLNGPANVGEESNPSLVDDMSMSPTISEYFVSGGNSLNVNTLTGGSWFVFGTTSNALPDANLRVLVMQITSPGAINGTINCQIFPLGQGDNAVQISIDFEGIGTFEDDEGITNCGCMDASASNYDSNADYDDGSCCYLSLLLSSTDANCFGGYGEIVAAVSDTLVSVSYTLLGPIEETNETGQFVVTAGTYSVACAVAETDSTAMCATTMEIEVGEGSEITMEASSTDATSGTLGVGSVTATGGSGGFSYFWYDVAGNEVDSSGLSAGEYFVTAIDSNECAVHVWVLVGFVESIEDIDSGTFLLYPNPTSGVVTLKVSQEMQNVNLQVIDAVGRVVYAEVSRMAQGLITLDLSFLPNGTYTINLKNNNGVTVHRLCVQD